MWVMVLALWAAPAGRGQDAATEEKFRQLRGRIEDLTAGQDALSKRLEELARQVEGLRQDQGRPQPNYAGLDDVKRLAKAIEEDREEIENLKKIRTELKQLTDSLKGVAPSGDKRPPGTGPTPGSRRHKPPAVETLSTPEQGSGSETGFKYKVQSGDTIAAIAAAFQAKGVRVTPELILKANPSVKAKSLRVGTELFIPQPQAK
jgi:LysM repeat protein